MEQKQKRAVCISCFQHHYESRIKYVIKELDAAKFNVTLIISDFDHIKKRYSKFNLNKVINIHVPSYYKNLSLFRILSHFVFAIQSYKAIKKIQPDYIYYLIPPNSPIKYIKKYKRKNNCIIIFDIYDCWPESFPYGKYKILLYFPFMYWKKIRDKHLNCANKLICVSEDCAAYMKSIHPKIKTEVLLPFIDEGDCSNYNSSIDNQLEICYLGSINHLFDIELCLKILSAINKIHHVTLHIIGEGENLKVFKSKCEEVGIIVVCHGVIYEWEKKKGIFEYCSFGLNVYKTSAHVTMTLKSIEYIKAGIPLINNAFGDTEEMVKKYNIGINIREYSFLEIAEIIKDLSSEKLITMHENCLKLNSNKFRNQNVKKILGLSI